MALSTWWLNDPFPDFSPLPGLAFHQTTDYVRLSSINQISLLEVHARRHSGNRPYLATINGQPAAYGWVASETAAIGELNLRFSLPNHHRYLWDFATLPEFRGLGIYPRLLQAILHQELAQADHFWIIHAPENLPSGAGIDKAGFVPIGQLSFTMDGGVGLQPFDDLERARAGAEMLGIPLIDAILSPCWCCGGSSLHRCGVEEALSCWPPIQPALTPACTCAVPVWSKDDRRV